MDRFAGSYWRALDRCDEQRRTATEHITDARVEAQRLRRERQQLKRSIDKRLDGVWRHFFGVALRRRLSRPWWWLWPRQRRPLDPRQRKAARRYRFDIRRRICGLRLLPYSVRSLRLYRQIVTLWLQVHLGKIVALIVLGILVYLWATDSPYWHLLLNLFRRGAGP